MIFTLQPQPRDIVRTVLLLFITNFVYGTVIGYFPTPDHPDLSRNPPDISRSFKIQHVSISNENNTSSWAKDIPIRGVVIDENGQKIPGVSVTIKGSKKGTNTDINGAYSLDVSDARTILVFSFVGYLTKEVVVGNSSQIDISLQVDNKILDEVVVVGYGSRSKRDVTTAISTISAREIEKNVTMSPEFAMQGRMTGVQVAGNSGNPMARPTIRIRGVNTWGVSSPLFVIDGIPVTEFGSGIEGRENARANDVRGPLNIMSMIDPNDIESISVLKDATSAAIYGVRAANGVILITTKKGKGDSPSIDISSRFGVQNIPQRIDVMNTQEYANHIRTVFQSDPTIAIAPDNVGLFDPSNPRYLGNNPTYDWQDAIKNRNAPMQEHSMRISGGTGKTDYFVSGSYSFTDGTLIGSNLERISGSFKLNSQIKEWLKVGVNYRITSANGQDNSFALTFWQTAQTPPWQPIFDENGVNGYASVVPGLGPDGVYRSTRLFGAGTRNNYPGQLSTDDQRLKSMRNMGNVYIEIEPLKHVKVRGQISLDNYTTNRFTFRDFRSSVFSVTAGNPYTTARGASVGFYGERDVYNTNLVKELSINYNNTIKDHTIDLLLNGMVQDYGSKYTNMESEFLTTTLPQLRRLGGENQFTNIQSDLSRNVLAGLLGRVGYNYKSKYYLDLTLRRDGSTRFAPENRWGNFPAASAAWRLSQEEFIKSLTWIDDLKLRAGWGRLGNQEVRDLAYLSPVDVRPAFVWGNSNNNGLGFYNNGATVFAIPNPGLQWETTTTSNIGFDAMFLGRLSVSLEYYNKLTRGILQEVSIPFSVGVVQQPVDNVASVRNSGVELSMSYSNNLGKLNYSVGGNITTVRNLVVNTYKDIPLFNIERGFPLFYQRGYKVGGLFQSNEEIEAWKAQFTDVNYQAPRIAPGDLFFQDIRSAPKNPNEFYSLEPDGRIDNFDQVYLGKTIPGFFYGINTDFSYRGFDFGMQFTGVGDVVKYNQVRAALEYSPTTSGNLSRSVFNSWSPTNTSSTMPRIMGGDPAQNFRNSDYFVESAAYLRLNFMQLGYTLPGSSIAKLTNGSIRNIRLYTGASNVFTLTKYTGLDPENDHFPTSRVFFFGLNIRL